MRGVLFTMGAIIGAVSIVVAGSMIFAAGMSENIKAGNEAAGQAFRAGGVGLATSICLCLFAWFMK